MSAARECVLALLMAVVCAIPRASAQTVSDRGFIEGALFAFPETAPNDSTRIVGDGLLRGEAFYKPAAWLQVAIGGDLRANSHDQVENSWRVDFSDRGIKRPRLSIRRASVSASRGRLTVEAGKQFVRWGKTDIVTPTDRFAPRDYLNVVDNDFLAITALRANARFGTDSVEVAWSPRFTPSRLPLIDQRWSPVPAAAASLTLVDGGSVLPSGSEYGIRWSHVGGAIEFAGAFFEGFNHEPLIAAAVDARFGTLTAGRVYAAIRTYGGDVAVPTRWFTLKGEAAYFTARASESDEFVLYVIQLERQTGEWVLVGGYAGDVVTRTGTLPDFSPDRGLSRAFVGRATYTIDTNRDVAVETAVRQNGHGAYGKVEYSHARGAHWRTTVALIGIAGQDDDFLGAYRHNSHALATVRYSF